MKQVTVDVWSDFVCPWCWIAKSRLEKAAERLGGEIEVVVSQHAYRTARGMEPEAFQTALLKKFGSAASAKRMMDAVAMNGDIEGLKYNFDTMRFGDTIDAHVLVKAVAPGETQSRLIEGIFAAGTTEGLDIFDRDVLLSIAQGAGVSTGKFRFDDRSVISEVEADETLVNKLGSGVPLFVFNRQTFLTGAQDVATFEKALLQAAPKAAVNQEGSNAETCGSDGCRI